MMHPMTLLLLLVLASWAIREVCGLVQRKQRKARGDRG